MSTPLVAVGGPTGAGKSGLAVALAKRFNGEVVGCDSLQVYRHFDIGTAKLTESDWGGIPHHLIDVIDAPESFTAGDFLKAGRSALRGIQERGRLPIVVGGTGFYLRALLDGLPVAPPCDEDLRCRLLARDQRRPGALHRILRRLDPASARKIHRRDTPKLIRALEIRLKSGRARSELIRSEPLRAHRSLKLALFPDRDVLYRTLDTRCEQMFAGGLIEETESLLARGVPPDSKPFQSLGYRQAIAVLLKHMDLEEALEEMRRETRHYAKRQITWFRREPAIVPLRGFGWDRAIEQEAVGLTARLLNSA